MPKISVIIPTYNRATLIPDAIESVLGQDVRGTELDLAADVEIIVADDGSTDNTAEVVGGYGSRVRYLALPHRGQPAAPRNAALAVATGEFIAFLDSDDLFLPRKFALQFPALQADPGLGLVYSDGYFFDDDQAIPTGSVQAGLPKSSGNILGDLLRSNFLYTPVVLARRTWLDRAGPFDESAELRAVEDYHLWLRMAIHAPARFVPGDVAAIRHHPGNISRDQLRMRRRILTVLARLDQEYPAVMAAEAQARQAAYAINHAAIAQAAWQERQRGAALRGLATALWHLAHLPKFGYAELQTWRLRRNLRQTTPPQAG